MNEDEGSDGRLSEDIGSLALRSLGLELKRVIRPAAICVIPIPGTRRLLQIVQSCPTFPHSLSIGLRAFSKLKVDELDEESSTVYLEMVTWLTKVCIPLNRCIVARGPSILPLGPEP